MTYFSYPSYEAVRQAHAKIIEATGGHAGMITSSNLKYILEAVQDIGEEFSEESSIRKKAAYLMYNIVVSHPFLDGNKRSAFEVTRRFLELNYWIFNPAQEESFEKLVGMASGRLKQDDVEEWIGMNLRPRGV
ncbi:MAG TPA: Fic family protein [Nitrososphaerales archaeon]|nr:Fic family protein [Nitrososphaerales archaeon]